MRYLLLLLICSGCTHYKDFEISDFWYERAESFVKAHPEYKEDFRKALSDNKLTEREFEDIQTKFYREKFKKELE